MFCRLSRWGINLRSPLNTGFQLPSFFPGQILGLWYDLVPEPQGAGVLCRTKTGLSNYFCAFCRGQDSVPRKRTLKPDDSSWEEKREAIARAGLAPLLLRGLGRLPI